MSKHTPGPWVADDNEGFSMWKIYSRMSPSGSGVQGPCVAEVIGDSAEADANALLIAAAPELLEALYIVDACGDPKRVTLYDGEAEGWEWVHFDGREWHEVGCWEDGPPMHPAARAAIAKAEGVKP